MILVRRTSFGTNLELCTKGFQSCFSFGARGMAVLGGTHVEWENDERKLKVFGRTAPEELFLSVININAMTSHCAINQ